MSRVNNLINNIIKESYIQDDDNSIDNKFYDIVKSDAEEFADNIKQGEGWIAEPEIMEQFLMEYNDYDCKLINLDIVENIVIETLKYKKTSIKTYEEAQEEGLL